MSNFYTYKNLEALKIRLTKTKNQLEALQAKVDNLPHPAVLGDSLKKINNKFEVVKLKNEIGDKNLTYDGLKILFDKYNKTLQTFRNEITEIELKLKVYDQWFDLPSVSYLTTGFKNNTINYFLHTDGEFSFHYWQNPSLIVNYKKPEAYVFTQLFGINQSPRITDWSPYIEYDFNANTGEVDVRLASFKKTGAGWDKKIYLVIKTEEGDTSFDFKKNPLNFIFKNKTYNIQNLLDKIHDRPAHKEVLFNKEVLNITREVAVEDENGNVMLDKKGKILKKQNPNVVENGNIVEIHGYSELIRNTKFVGKTLQFEFVRCTGDEDKLHGTKYKYNVYSVIFEADKLPALDTSTWTKIYKMDSRVQWIEGNRGEIKTEHWDDCIKGAPTIQLKLESSGYYLRFVWNGFLRWWTGTTINFSTKSLWTNFKIIADVYK